LVENAKTYLHGAARDMMLSQDDKLGYAAERQVMETQKLYDSITHKREQKRMEIARLRSEFYRVRGNMTSPEDLVLWKGSISASMGEDIMRAERELQRMTVHKRTITSSYYQAQDLKDAATIQYWNRCTEETLPSEDVRVMAKGVQKSAEQMRRRHNIAGEVRNSVTTHSEVVGDMLEEQDDAEQDRLDADQQFEDMSQSLTSFIARLEEEDVVAENMQALPRVPVQRPAPARRGKERLR